MTLRPDDSPAPNAPCEPAITCQLLVIARLALAWATGSPVECVDLFAPVAQTVDNPHLAWLVRNLPINLAATARDKDIAEVQTLLGCPDAWTPATLSATAQALVETTMKPRVRKRFGAFYTPRWLAQLALRQVGWNNTSRLVDPTCGAGAFLVAACLTARSEPNSIVGLSDRIIGFDIDPLAILAARVACFAAVCDLVDPNTPFAPHIDVANLFDSPATAPCDIVIGNPPWIRFSDLDTDSAKRAAAAAVHYGLVPKHFHGGSQLDLAAVCTYRMLDVYLRHSAKAALVLPSSLLRAPSAAAFRSFRLPDDTCLHLDHVTDFGPVRVFSYATNRTALLCWTKGPRPIHPSSHQPTHLTQTRQPINARVVRTGKNPLENSSLHDAIASLRPVATLARFIGPDRRIVCSPLCLDPRLDGKTPHLRGRKGITTDLNGAFFVRVLGIARPGLLRVVNDITQTRTNSRTKPVPVHTFEVERDLVFPLLKGAQQIHPFRITTPTIAVLLPNRNVSLRAKPNENTTNPRQNQLHTHPPSHTDLDAQFSRLYPAARAHFEWIETHAPGLLAARSTHRRMGSKGPFYRVYNVGDYTFAPYKVVWAEMQSSFVAAVSSAAPLFANTPPKVIVPDHKVYFAPCHTLPEALFVCALLNSSPVRSFINATTHELQVGTLLDRVKLPPFSAQNHAHEALVTFAHTLHTADCHNITTNTRALPPHLQLRLDNLAEAALQSSP